MLPVSALLPSSRRAFVSDRLDAWQGSVICESIIDGNSKKNPIDIVWSLMECMPKLAHSPWEFNRDGERANACIPVICSLIRCSGSGAWKDRTEERKASSKSISVFLSFLNLWRLILDCFLRDKSSLDRWHLINGSDMNRWWCLQEVPTIREISLAWRLLPSTCSSPVVDILDGVLGRLLNRWETPSNKTVNPCECRLKVQKW